MWVLQYIFNRPTKKYMLEVGQGEEEEEAHAEAEAEEEEVRDWSSSRARELLSDWRGS